MALSGSQAKPFEAAASSSQRTLYATPSYTERSMWSLVCSRPRLAKLERTVVSPTGERSPKSHGKKMSLPEPGSIAAAASSSDAKTPAAFSSGVAKLSANHSRQSPAVSDSPIMMFMAGSGEATAAIP